jgi:hypothetical protein
LSAFASVLVVDQAFANAASSMCAAMKKSVSSLGTMRRPSSAVAAPPNQRERSPRAVTSCCAVWQTLSCACA